MNLRGWLLIILFAHVMLHPWVHVIGIGKPPASATVLAHNTSSHTATPSADHCELCRVGHSATPVPQLPKTDLLNPRCIHTAIQAANYASLQADRSLPCRAPPLS